MVAFKWGNRKKCAGARSGDKEGDQVKLPSSETEIGAHGSHCLQGHYRGTASIFRSSATLAEPAAYAVAVSSKLRGKMRFYWFDLQEKNYLWMMPLLLKKAFNGVLTMDFCRRLYFWSRGTR